MPHGSTLTQNSEGRLQSPLHEQISDERHEFELTVLIPCLNEQRTIAHCVKVALDAMASHGIAGEVLVSDNGILTAAWKSPSPLVRESSRVRLVAMERRFTGAFFMQRADMS